METVNENAYERMQAGARLERAREVAAKANAAALAAEKARDAAEAEVEALELALNPKRRCTDKAAVEEEESAVAIDDWDLADHRRESTCAMNRRAVELIEMPARQPREPRTGQHGYLHHTRHGLVGAVAYWAGGSLAIAVTMIVALIVHLKVVDKVRAAQRRLRPHLCRVGPGQGRRPRLAARAHDCQLKQAARCWLEAH